MIYTLVFIGWYALAQLSVIVELRGRDAAALGPGCLLRLAMFGLFLQSMPDAVRYAEVEPFKTAITLRFQREWPFVAYALALIIDA